ncbi:multidrug resistance-associated protein 1 [Elysia marginata]|uniref:Multidrug resistance-associated protein 1 n=1 Tax=Elysia marginata TaxID=1093978 RepID=A0AAV4FDX0_9GAST|nr:multidrug resistance-associated protein 1 [Elysia marginata]
MDNTSHASFCGDSPFWDSDLLLNSSYPKFTQCFQDTALVWVPCGVLWLTTPLYLPYMSHVARTTGTHRIPLNCFNMLKTFLVLLMVVVSVVRLVRDVSKDDVTTAQYISGAAYIATFLLVAVLIQIERNRGFVTSGVLFVVFGLLVVAGLVPVYSGIMERVSS